MRSLAAVVLIFCGTAMAQQPYDLGWADGGDPAGEAIMPLSDSIGRGGVGGEPVGAWRAPLYTKLKAAGYHEFHLVGPFKAPDPPEEPMHAARSGVSAVQYANILDYDSADGMHLWVQTHRFDTVLVMLLTNDTYQYKLWQSGIEALARVIQQLHATNPSVRVIVSTIPDSVGTTDSVFYGARAAYFNAALPVLVAFQQARGVNIQLVDPQLHKADLIDGTHLTAAGCAKVAQAFFCALVPADASCAAPAVDMAVAVSDMAVTVSSDVACPAPVSVSGCSLTDRSWNSSWMCVLLFLLLIALRSKDQTKRTNPLQKL